MKLRNKKTGAIVEAYKEEPIDLFLYLGTDGEGDELNRKTYHSIAELNEGWEDYNPTESLIKDNKIREIIKAWAKVNDATELKYDVEENSLEDIFRNSISFNRVLDLKDDKEYTIAELCGEEEE